jgi:hypothetical protein
MWPSTVGRDPHHLAGLRITRLDAADDAEFATRHAGQQQALGDDRRGGVRVPTLIVVDLFLPHDLAGVLVERDQLGVQRAEDDQIVDTRPRRDSPRRSTA